MSKFDLEHLKLSAAFSVHRENAHQGGFPGMAGSVNNDGCPGVGRFGIPSGPAARTMAREVAEARLRAHGDRLGR
jgi:hypothetical protein